MTALTTASQTTRAIDPYGTATRMNADEYRRMDLQFALHTAPLLGQAVTLLEASRGLKLLDVGSGYGAVLSAFGPLEFTPARLGLMDCNAALLDQAQARAEQAGVDTIAHASAIDEGPVPAFLRGNDLVLCSFAATHLRDLSAGIAHMADALRPGGLVVVTDVDYCASLACDDEAAQECLWHIQQKLVVRDLSTALPRLALRHGLRPVTEIACTEHLQAYPGVDAVRQAALAFVANFHDDDPAKLAWRRMGPQASVILRRMAHVYRRA